MCNMSCFTSLLMFMNIHNLISYFKFYKKEFVVVLVCNVIHMPFRILYGFGYAYLFD